MRRSMIMKCLLPAALGLLSFGNTQAAVTTMTFQNLTGGNASTFMTYTENGITVDSPAFPNKPATAVANHFHEVAPIGTSQIWAEMDTESPGTLIQAADSGFFTLKSMDVKQVGGAGLTQFADSVVLEGWDAAGTTMLASRVLAVGITGTINFYDPVSAPQWQNLGTVRIYFQSNAKNQGGWGNWNVNFANDFQLDNIKIDAVPLPAALPLFLSGIGLSIVARRRRVTRCEPPERDAGMTGLGSASVGRVGRVESETSVALTIWNDRFHPRGFPHEVKFFMCKGLGMLLARVTVKVSCGQGAGECFSGRRESIPGGSDAAVQASYALKSLPCSLRGSFMHRGEKGFHDRYRERSIGAGGGGLVFRDAVNPSMGARTSAIRAGDALQTSPPPPAWIFMRRGEVGLHEFYWLKSDSKFDYLSLRIADDTAEQ